MKSGAFQSHRIAHSIAPAFTIIAPACNYQYLTILTISTLKRVRGYIFIFKIEKDKIVYKKVSIYYL